MSSLYWSLAEIPIQDPRCSALKVEEYLGKVNRESIHIQSDSHCLSTLIVVYLLRNGGRGIASYLAMQFTCNPRHKRELSLYICSLVEFMLPLHQIYENARKRQRTARE
jgi:hypothetical protein